ncbi:MAG TPA: glycogen synthase [Anaerolineae bacterium]|nr:glycogen synthase [Anaerolineae bacterium]
MLTPNPTALKIHFIASEAEPFAKAGGLGDYAGSLPLALRELSANATNQQIDIRLTIPYHSSIEADNFSIKKICDLKIDTQERKSEGEAFLTTINGLPCYLISQNSPPYMNDSVYSTDAIMDGEKYIFFSLASLELLRKIQWKADIVHANDWHTAVAIYYLALTRNKNHLLKNTKTLQTIHNLPFMGEGTQPVLKKYNLPLLEDPDLPLWARQLPFALGLAKADEIVAVSPTYSQEIRTAAFGNGLEKFLEKRKEDISGILNGIDIKKWNPAQDQLIERCYTSENLQARKENKRAILSILSLSIDEDLPLLIMVSRLDRQKGIELILDGLHSLKELAWQAVLLGTGNTNLENACFALENDMPDRVRAVMRFDKKLAHQLFSAGDILMMPSLYEPCGTSQMIAMRYGCIPVATSVGGLKDSITNESDGTRTGFLFEKHTTKAFLNCLRRALGLFNRKKVWQNIQKRAMEEDFSWKRSAERYLKLYLGLHKQLKQPQYKK